MHGPGPTNPTIETDRSRPMARSSVGERPPGLGDAGPVVSLGMARKHATGCGCRRRDERGRARAICRATRSLAGFTYGLSAEALLRTGRGEAHVSEARHVAMYLAHVIFQIPPTILAPAFGRDRTTVAHGIRRIEERRDTAAFDAWLSDLEQVAAHLRGAIDGAAPCRACVLQAGSEERR